MKVYRAHSVGFGHAAHDSASRRRQLDLSQRQVLRDFRAGNSLAILGGAGSGKTFILTEIMKHADAVAGGSEKVAACALTNNAASGIGGCTLHSLFSAPPSWEWSKKYLWERVQRDSKKCEILSRINILIIDEVSLLKRNQIEAIDFVLRKLCKDEGAAALPLGGRQLVVAGDPFQLEAPGIEDTRCYFETFFQSRVWFLCFSAYGNGVVSILDHNHRQNNDTAFFDLLQRLRYGIGTKQDYQLLNSTSALTDGPPSDHTRLCLYVRQVNAINLRNLQLIPGEQIHADAVDSFSADRYSKSASSRLDQIAEKRIVLKKGCIVLLTRKCGIYMPGTRCEILDLVKGASGKLSELRLVLAVISSKAQNTRSCNEGSDQQDVFEIGVATFQVHSYDRKVVASRSQLPIALAYAMTIHRCQGFTLDAVAVDFRNMHNWHPNGMVYVALSRCRTERDLWVRGLMPHHIAVSERAKVMMVGLTELLKNLPKRVIGARALTRYIEDMEHWGKKMTKACEHGLQLGEENEQMVPPSNELCGTRSKHLTSSVATRSKRPRLN